MTIVNICLPGNADPLDSYGIIGTQLLRHLSRIGTYTNLFAMGERHMDSHDTELASIVAHPIRPSLGAIFLGYPTGYANHANPLLHMGPRIAVTMFESSRLPSGWVDALNGMDAVIVPSQFCAYAFALCGVTKPIHVIPLGIGEVYRYAERNAHRPLTFLAFLDRGERKGGLSAVKAFVKAFGEDTGYRLLLKARTRKNEEGITLSEPNITLIDRDMTEGELYRLYLACDVLINANKGEGFGLIPREFAATGGLALATDWGGTADDIDAWGMPIAYTLEPADWNGHKNLAGQDLGVWAKPDVDRLATRLLSIASNRSYYRQLGQVMAARARALYSWQKFAAKVLDVWKEAALGYANRDTAFAA